MHHTYRTAFIGVSLPLVAALLFGGCGKPKSAAPPGCRTAGGGGGHDPGADTTELAGRTSAFLVAEVRPQVSGIIQERLFVEGSDVTAGAVLYRIDPATYRAAAASAEAALARAQAARGAEANAVPRRLRAERFTELVAINAVSRQDADDATAAVRQSEAEIQSSEAAIGGSEAGIARAEDAVQVAARWPSAAPSPTS